MKVCGRDNVLGKLAVWNEVFIDLEKDPPGGNWLLSHDLETKSKLL